MKQKIETKRLDLRPYQLEDLDDGYDRFRNDIVTIYVGGAKTFEETKQYLMEALFDNPCVGRIAI